MRMKTAELSGAALDWAVAKCEGFDYNRLDGSGWSSDVFSPSTDWAQGGPIVEREGIDLCKQYALHSNTDWVARLEWLDESHGEGFGPTPLISAMRCYVASKLGDEVDVPDELQT